MATGFRTIPSAIAQQAALAQLREIQNPNLALERELQKAMQLQQLQQQSPEAQMALKIQQANLDKALREANQGKLMEVGGRLVRVNPNTGAIEVALEAAANSNKQFVGFSGGKPILFDPRNGSVTAGEVPSGLDFTGGIAPKTTPAETFSTVVTDQGIVKTGNRSTTATPLTMKEGGAVQAPKKPTTVSRFSDANGFLFNQSSTGGPASPVLDGEGNPINIGVANQVISSDQGIFTIPKKSEGGTGTGAPSASGGLQPLTGPAGTPLTKTTGKGGGTSEAGRALASETARRSIETVDELLPRVDNTTVGLAALTSGIPGSPALNFASDLSQLAANIRIGALQEMRNASKTGGAFGNVSNQEGRVLESTLGSLEQKQSPPQMRSNLNKIKASLQRYEEAKQKYGAPTSTGPVNIKTRAEFDKLPSGSQYIGPSGNLATKP